MECAGFRTQNIVDDGDYLVVEGDMVMKKQDLLTILEKENQLLNGGNKTDSWVIDTAVTLSYVSNILYYVHPTVNNLPSSNTWISAIQSATSAWNNIENCRITFVPTTNPNLADITIYAVDGLYYNGTTYVEAANTIPNVPTTELPACAIPRCDGIKALAAFPVDCRVGRWLVLSTCTDAVNQTQKNNIVTHELGHTLGFRHASFGCTTPGDTEASYHVECTSVNGANHLFWTPNCDHTSLMSSGAVDNALNDYDKMSARMLYPDCCQGNLSISGVTTNSCGTHCRSWQATISNTMPWYQLRLLLRNSAGQNVKLSNWVLGDNTTLTLNHNIAGTYKLIVQGKNYRGETVTTSGGVTVVVP